jgi:hypothetical protein
VTDLQEQITRLKGEIEELQAILTDQETQVLDLEYDLNTFKARYDRIVLPVETRLKAAKEAVAELEHQRISRLMGDEAPLTSTWTPPEGYVSVEEQFRRAWQKPAGGSAPPPRPTVSQVKEAERATTLKKLYRQLASRYHPDLTTDPDERVTRTQLMARINEAYAQRDLEALQALAAQGEPANPDAPLAALHLRELQQIRRQLAERIEFLERQRLSLMHSDLMDLKLEDQFARLQGRDLLQEIADRLEEEYATWMARLDKLRRGR